MFNYLIYKQKMTNMLKKALIAWTLLTSTTVSGLTFAQTTTTNWSFTTNWNAWALDSTVWGFWDDRTWNVKIAWTGQWAQQTSLISIITNFINWMLWMLFVIALVILLYWGFQMVTAAWDDGKYKKWFTILRQAAIGIVIIGLSFFIVQIVFGLLNRVWANNTWQVKEVSNQG